MLAPQAHGKGLELTAFVGDDVPAVVRGDRGRLRQVVTNLVSNAVKFTHRGEVSVRVELVARDGEDATLRFEVADTGIGIEPAALSTLFDSFSQADTSTTRRYGGTGLGLAISRQLVELMGGDIGADSAPGEGSRFHFTVALPAPASAAPARRSAGGRAGGRQGPDRRRQRDQPRDRRQLPAHRAERTRPRRPAAPRRSPSCTRPRARASRSTSSCSTRRCPRWTASTWPPRSARRRACGRRGS